MVSFFRPKWPCIKALDSVFGAIPLVVGAAVVCVGTKYRGSTVAAAKTESRVSQVWCMNQPANEETNASLIAIYWLVSFPNYVHTL